MTQTSVELTEVKVHDEVYSPLYTLSPSHRYLEVATEDSEDSQLKRSPRKKDDDIERKGGEEEPRKLIEASRPPSPVGENDNYGRFQGFLALVAYVGLYPAMTSLIHSSKAIKHTPALLVMGVLLMKLLLSLAYFLLRDGTPRDLVAMVRANVRPLGLYVIPAVTYTLTDSLTVFCASRLSPSTLALLANARIVFLLLLWQRLLRRSLNVMHWIAMGMVCLGVSLKHVVLSESTEKERSDESSILLVATLAALAAAQLSAFAAVYNEKLLKEQKLPLALQNLAFYVFGFGAAVVISAFSPSATEGLGKGFHSALLDLESWKAVWTTSLFGAVLLMAVYGLTASVVVKRLDSVTKEIGGALQLLLSIVLDATIFLNPPTLLELIAATIVAGGVFVYNRAPAPQLAKPRQATTKN